MVSPVRSQEPKDHVGDSEALSADAASPGRDSNNAKHDSPVDMELQVGRTYGPEDATGTEASDGNGTDGAVTRKKKKKKGAGVTAAQTNATQPQQQSNDGGGKKKRNRRKLRPAKEKVAPKTLQSSLLQPIMKLALSTAQKVRILLGMHLSLYMCRRNGHDISDRTQDY